MTELQKYRAMNKEAERLKAKRRAIKIDLKEVDENYEHLSMYAQDIAESLVFDMIIDGEISQEEGIKYWKRWSKI